MASTSGAQTVTYTYDAQGRVKTASQPGAASAYTYDKADNRTQIAVSTTAHTINTVPDDASIPVGQWVDINAKNNDIDTLGHALTITGISQQGVLGNAVVQSNGTIRYTAGSTAGPDTVKYTVSDGQISAVGTITVTVTGSAPTVAGGSISIANNASNISLPLGISGGATSVSLVASPTQGQATPSGTQILYTPYAGGARSDSLTFTASNANGTSNVGTVSISIAAPVVQKPVANTSSATVAANSASNVIPLNITGSYTSVAYVTGTSHGSVQAVGAQMYYTPFTNYFGPDSFTYTATNASGTSNVGAVNLTVSPPPPTANNISATVAGNSSNNSLPLNFSGGSPTSVQVYSTPSHGTATVSGTSILYTPTPGYSGSDGFYYRGNNAAGWGGSALASINVTAPNQNPVARENTTILFQSQSVQIDPRAATIDPQAPGDSDPDGDPLTITSVQPLGFSYARVNGVDYNGSTGYPFSLGTFSVSGQTINYTAPYLCSVYGCHLVVVFYYTISDGRGGTSTAPHVIIVYSQP
jgi:YD repeat-containing protein